MRISDWSSDVCASDLPSNGIGFFSGLKRSSLFMISSMRSAIACRVALSGHSIQLNTIDSSSLDATAPKKSLIFPLGTSSSQQDRQSAVLGKSVSVRVDLVGRRFLTNTTIIYLS